MSKGGAGKVYFVLYLAVILELLIIFIERDEAEENLRRQQQQAIQIVQTILSQLQTGVGATGITASPKDNIVLDQKDPQTMVRNYTVYVAVGDPKASSIQKGKTIQGDDVSKLEYIVSYLPNPDKLENELGADSTDITDGEVIFRAGLGKDYMGYETPQVFVGEGNAPVGPDAGSTYFRLNDSLTKEMMGRGKRVKAFSVNFKPNRDAGWYRLRFYSETNKILGVTGEPKDDDTVRIGNIKLTVKQLRQVQKVLRKQRGADGSTSQVEKYIEQLLTADAYKKLAENQAYTSFDVHVVRPDLPPPADPFAAIASPRDTIYWLDAAPFSVQVTLGPKDATGKGVSGADIAVVDQARNLYVATVAKPSLGTNTLTATSSNGGKRAIDEKYLVVEKPLLRAAKFKEGQQVTTGIDAWRGLAAVYGMPYDPSSEWANPTIPADHYQTIVRIKGVEVLNRPGVSFKNLSADQLKQLVIPDGTKPDEIVTRVFWKPGGTPDSTKWVLLIANQEGLGQVIALEKRKMKVGYRSPELSAEQYDFVAQFNPKKKDFTSAQFRASQKIGAAENGVNVTATCAECAQYGLDVYVNQVDDMNYTLTMKAPSDFNKLLRAPELKAPKRFDIDIQMQGRGDPKTEGMSITLQVSPR